MVYETDQLILVFLILFLILFLVLSLVLSGSLSGSVFHSFPRYCSKSKDLSQIAYQMFHT